MELTGALIVAGPANGFPFDAPTPIGRALAAAFRDAATDTRLIATLQSGDLTKTVPREVLVEFARKACLCQLRVAESHDLPLLRDLFLHSGTPQEVASRSETLRMLLDLSGCNPNEAINQDDFRQIIYFRELADAQYAPRGELVDVARRWRIYQGREYFGYVFNGLLRWVSRRGLLETDAGLTLLPSAGLWDLVAQALDESAADDDMDLALPEVNAETSVSDFLAYLKAAVEVDVTGNEVWPRHEGLDEHALHRACRDFDADDGQTLVACLR